MVSKLMTFIIATFINWLGFIALGIFMYTLPLKYNTYISTHVDSLFFISLFSFLILIIVGIFMISSYAKKGNFPPNP